MRKNKIPLMPRYQWVLKKVRAFMKQSGIQKLPVDPLDLYDMYDWICITNEEAEHIKGKRDPFSLIRQRADAKTYRQRASGDFVTVYDEQQIPERIRWTLAHEIGHIVLGHLTDFQLTDINRGLNPEEYKVLEQEANCFASELLAPLIVLKNLGVEKLGDVKLLCDLSWQASNNRVNQLKKHKIICKSQFDLLWHFKDFVSKVAICGELPINHPFAHHAIKLPRRRFEMNQKLDAVLTDENGKYLSCPRCGCGSFSGDASFCKICGIYLYNLCSNEITIWDANDYCGAKNSGDARYCEYCGHETFLMKQGLLTSWEEVLKAKREAAIAEEFGTSFDDDQTTVEIDDDDLPF